MDALYTATATIKGGRQGHGRTDDGKVDVDLSLPKGLGGAGGEGTNPEQLFAIGYGACFLGAVNFVAATQKKNIGDATLHSKVSVMPDNGGWKLAVELTCNLPGVSLEEANAIVQEAHANVCPYSKATRGNIDVIVRAE